jgi:DNA adenine methylase
MASPKGHVNTVPEKIAHGPSFLRWAGSKRKSLSELSAFYVDPDQHYVEPFAGSAALFFSLRPASATLGDLNGQLINALRQVRDDPLGISKAVRRMRRSSRNYYLKREEFNQLRPFGQEAAALFIYLNRNCFNGLWRTNSVGTYNVPYGGTEMGKTPPLALFVQCAQSLRNASLRHQDFRKTLANIDKPSFIYADPPYFSATERTFVEYGKRSFGRRDLNDLIDALVSLSKRGSSVVLTYSDSMRLKNIPKTWRQTTFEVTRNVGGFTGSRKLQTEIVYTNVS